MATVATETEQDRSLVYSVILLCAGKEDDDIGEVMGVIQAHLEVAARDGRELEITLRRV